MPLRGKKLYYITPRQGLAGSMDPKRALKTHMALFKTRKAYHVYGYWRENAVSAHSRRVGNSMYSIVFCCAEESIAARDSLNTYGHNTLGVLCMRMCAIIKACETIQIFTVFVHVQCL